MKIGILTQPLHCNYGGILQNMALQTVLKAAGHEVITLDHAAPEKSRFNLLKWEIKKRVRHILNRSRYPVVLYTPDEDEKKALLQDVDAFVGKHITLSPLLRSEEAIAEYAADGGFDAFVVGSDQCWRPRYNPFIKSMFLSFCKDRTDLIRLAYAASFGTAGWEYDDGLTASCSELLQKFDGVSVREDSGVVLCREKLGTDARLVLDPTMLLSREEYSALADEETAGRGILVHILDPDPEKDAAIMGYSAHKGTGTFSILPKHQMERISVKAYRTERESCRYASPARFIRAFMDADETVVDSFHACVFSIIFNKPFRVIANSSRGNARFGSLLRMFGLEDRLVTAGNLGCGLKPVDWNDVNARLAALKEESLGFLFSHLKQK